MILPMPSADLPIEVRHFLAEHIGSLEQLEILLLLREQSQRAWSVAEVFRVVRSSERSAAETLSALCKQGLLRAVETPAGAYQFGPPEPLKETIAAVARLYAERRVKIVEAIYSERVSEVDQFAKAFRLRKDPHG